MLLSGILPAGITNSTTVVPVSVLTLKRKSSAPGVIDSVAVSVSGSQVKVSGGASDPNNDVQLVQLTILKDGAVVASAAATGTTSYAATVSGLAQGSYSARVQAFDGTGFASALTEPIPFDITVSTLCVKGSNGQHKNAGRATVSKGSYFAVGSNDALGKNAGTVTSLSGSSGYWKKVSKCP